MFAHKVIQNLFLMEGIDSRWFFMEETEKGLKPWIQEDGTMMPASFGTYDQAVRWLMGPEVEVNGP